MWRVTKYILIAIAIAAAWWFYRAIQHSGPWSWPRSISVTGVIRDGSTQQHVTDARIIVTVHYDFMYWSDMYAYATTTDEQGRFEIKEQAPFPVQHVAIEALSSSGKYGSTHVKPNATKAKTQVLYLKEPPENLPAPTFRYEKFEGRRFSSISVRNIKFLKEAWDIRNSHEVRRRDRLPTVELDEPD